MPNRQDEVGNRKISAKRIIFGVVILAFAGVALAVAVSGMRFLQPGSDKTGLRRVYDEARIIPESDVRRFEGYFKWIFKESDIDVRLVLLKDLSGVSLENAAIDWMERLKIGARGREERGVLVLYDLTGKSLRVEVGYGLEEYLPDAFIGYLMNDHARMFFHSGNVSKGLQLMIRILHKRIRLAILGERFDPTVLTVIRREGPLSGGAGASANIAFRQDSSHYVRSKIGSESSARYTAQESPEQTYMRYLEWMTQEQYDPDIDLFTPETRKYMKGLPMSKAYFNYILLGEYGKRFRTDIRGDLALLYFTNDPFVSPHFFRRRDNRWYMDICAEVSNTVERVGGVYTWDYRGRDDDFTKSFFDKLVDIDGYVRIVDGDNRQLPTRESLTRSSDTEGWTKLHFAAARGEMEKVKGILDRGEDINVRDAKGRTPLYEAAKRGRLDVVKLLVERGAAINTHGSDVGFTPLHVASERKHAEIVRYLISKGAAVDAKNKWDQTPLWQAAWQTWHQDAEIADILLQNGADPNARDNKGFTPLHKAARRGHVSLVRLLLKGGADVHSRTIAGATPLHEAVHGNYLEIVKLLLENHADVNAAIGNRTLLQFADQSGYEGIANLLREHGARN